MNIIVTGGGGYIGSHTCKALSKAGYSPITYDNMEYGHEWAVKWGPLVVGDIRDAALLEETIKKYEPVAVIHFAGYAYVGESVENPAKYYVNNVAGTLNLLEAMRRQDVGKIVFSSSCTTYGNAVDSPIDETHSQAPLNPYGRSKLMVERILEDCAKAYGLEYTILRYFNAAGADPDGEIGECHDPEPHLIPSIIESVIHGDKSVRIFGDDYNTPDGTCIRDYVHVSDLADAHVRALSYLSSKMANEVFNLGIGKGYSVLDVVRSVEKISRSTIRRVVDKRRAGDPPILISSHDKAKAVLGWTPKLRNLDAIIETSWKWHMKHHVPE